MDTKYVQLATGGTAFQFGAIDCFTRKRVVALSPKLTSRAGAHFLARFPFPR